MAAAAQLDVEGREVPATTVGLPGPAEASPVAVPDAALTHPAHGKEPA